MQFGGPGLADIGDVDPTAAETWQHQFVSRLAAVTMATRAGVPAAVMQLVIQMGHHQSMYHLGGGGENSTHSSRVQGRRKRVGREQILEQQSTTQISDEGRLAFRQRDLKNGSYRVIVDR